MIVSLFVLLLKRLDFDSSRIEDQTRDDVNAICYFDWLPFATHLSYKSSTLDLLISRGHRCCSTMLTTFATPLQQ